MVTATVKQNNLQKIMTDYRSRMWQKWEGSCILTVKSNSRFQKKYYLGKTVQVYEHICLPNYPYPVPLGARYCEKLPARAANQIAGNHKITLVVHK